MHTDALMQIVSLKALPEDVLKRIKLLNFADSNHVLGQMAVAHEGKHDGKILDIFENALLRCAHDHGMLRFEINRLARALTGTGVTPVVLKGGAYVAVQHKAANGRRVSDIDILVTEEQLPVVEKALDHAGWRPDEETDNAYDQEYYREWMHELPPLRHRKRGTIIDVHHRLLPKTARTKLLIASMIEDAVKLEGHDICVFKPQDMFIHSAVHALGDGSFDNPVRSLIELYYLFEGLSDADKNGLAHRANEVGAEKTVKTTLWSIANFFKNEDAAVVMRQLKGGSTSFLLKWMIKAKTLDGMSAPLSKACFYIRGHYMRMPLHLLIPHLAHKALKWRPTSNKPVELPKP